MKKSFAAWFGWLCAVAVSAQIQPVVISEVFYDTPLDEHWFADYHGGGPYFNGEFVELFNPTTQTVDLSGWSLKDEDSSYRFVFPAGSTMPARSSIVIAYRSGSSPGFVLADVFPAMADTAHTPVVYQDKVVLANTKEAVRLLDSQGMLRDSVYYGNVTAIQPIADRLVAENEDSIPGYKCLSVQRRRIAHDPAGCAVASHLDREVALVPEEGGGLPPIEMALVVPTMPSISSRINSIITRTALDGVSDMDHPGSARVLTTVQYYDGLGRPVQAVWVGASPTGADLADLTEYDDWGRAYRQWLPTPVADNHGGYVSGISSTAMDFHCDTKPYEETILERSPLNRVLGTKHPGYAFHEHPTGVEYGTNEEGEVKWLDPYGRSSGIQSKGYYPAGRLYKTTRTDEDGNTAYEYTDLLGQVVLTRQMSDGMAHDTYYIYDGFGNLVCVVPPLLADHVGGTAAYPFDGDTWMEDYAYCYRYDQRNRCVQKRLPGCEWVYQVYDKTDRLVLTQDGNQRAHDKWTSYKYDRLGRLVYTAEVVDDTPFNQMSGNFNDWLVVEEFSTQEQEYPQEDTGYSKNFYHLAETGLLTVNYYDNYDFLELLDDQTKRRLAYAAEDGYGEQYPDATGLRTGTHAYLLDGSGQYLATAYYYDNRGRVVQERSTNYIQGYDVTCNRYDFAGNLLRSSVSHSNPNYGSYGGAGETYTHEYDHAGRLLRTWYKVTDLEETLLTEYEYDETGRMTAKKQHNGQNTVNYAYNIRNWPTAIEDGDFKESLYYCGNGAIALYGANNLYNGNISSATCTSGGKSHTYAYTYDGLNRLTAAKNHAGASIVMRGNDAVSYNEEFTYDKHGNIITLQRNTQGKENVVSMYDPETGQISPVIISYSAVPFDRLSMDYDGNRLVSVTDEVEEAALYNRKEYHDWNTEGNDFAYDANDNMLHDLDRDIVTVRYNLLNLPDTVQFRDGRQIVNRYAADGRRVRSWYYTPVASLVSPISVEVGELHHYNLLAADTYRLETTAYAGSVEYMQVGPVLYDFLNVRKVHNPEGYVQRSHGGTFSPYYYRRDHLGNVREVWKPSGDSAVTVQRTRYYPSGLPWEYQAGDSASLQPYKYGSKEFVETHGLDMYDSHARWYDPRIMRTITSDPLAEEYYNVSPYVWCGNNPVNWVDKDGKQILMGGPVLNLGTEKIVTAILPYTDFNDAWVFGSAILSGFTNIEPQHIDGTPATSEDIEAAKNALLLPVVNGSALIKTEKAINALLDTKKTGNSIPNPYGAKGKPDHQAKVLELREKAMKENPGMEVIIERKINIEGSDRRPDVQVRDPRQNGKTIKVYEAERNPNSRRNLKREEEYRRLGIPFETHKVGEN